MIPPVSLLDQTRCQLHRGWRRCGPGQRFGGEHDAGLSRVSASGRTWAGSRLARGLAETYTCLGSCVRPEFIAESVVAMLLCTTRNMHPIIRGETTLTRSLCLSVVALCCTCVAVFWERKRKRPGFTTVSRPMATNKCGRLYATQERKILPIVAVVFQAHVSRATPRISSPCCHTIFLGVIGMSSHFCLFAHVRLSVHPTVTSIDNRFDHGYMLL